MTVPTLTLHDGATIPQLGFGVFEVPPARTAEVVAAALDVGYRHIDTAEMYENERGVGEAIAASGLPREELYVTSKLGNGLHRPDDARRAFDRTLADLGLDRVDLFLVHWPLPTLYDGDYVSTWRTLGELAADGRATSIGVSNFTVGHLQRIIDETGVVPAVNQVEAHPRFGNEELRAAHATWGIRTEAWAPLGRGKGLLDDPVITGIASRLGRTPAQVTLRWHLQRGDIVFPKSMHVERMRENFDVFDFTITEDDVAAISGLDRGAAGRIGPDPEVFDYVPG